MSTACYLLSKQEMGCALMQQRHICKASRATASLEQTAAYHCAVAEFSNMYQVCAHTACGHPTHDSFHGTHLVDLSCIHGAKAVCGEVAKQTSAPVHVLHHPQYISAYEEMAINGDALLRGFSAPF